MLVQTKRTVMRPFMENDLGLLKQLCTSIRVMEFIPPHFGIESDQQIRERLDTYLAHHDEHGVGFCVVTDKNGKFLGRAGFCFIPEVNLYEIGYLLLPEYWGRGLATEIVTGLINYAFDNLLLDSVCARTVAGNDASDNVLQKTGFSYIGERAFNMNDRVFIWNYYEHENETTLANTYQLYNTLVEDWDI